MFLNFVDSVGWSARDCQRLRRDAYCMILYVLSVQTEDGGR